MKNKWLIIGIAVVVIAAGILVFNGRGNNVSQPNAPVAPTAPTPVQAPSAVTNELIPAGVIKITAKKLVSELMVDHTKYEKGTVFQVSGVFRRQKEYFPNLNGEVSFFLGPMVDNDGIKVGVIICVDIEKESELFKAFVALEDGRGVVVQGTYFVFNNSYETGVILENASLISVTPAK